MKKLLFIFAVSISYWSCIGNKVAQPTVPLNNQNLLDAKVFRTTKGTSEKLSALESIRFQDMNQPLETEICVFVDPAKTFQNYVGIGGAITDATAETYYKMSPQKRAELLNAFFDKKQGIGYNVIRTNINSCDFSSDMYTYAKEGDKALNYFNIEHDLAYKVPLIKEALAKVPEAKVYASPWSPPAWMKTNNNMLQGGKLLPEWAPTWALYYTKFIKAYQSQGIPMWAITIQNEPMATQRWESCIYTAEEEAAFLKNHLGPTMHREGLKDVKIIAWDHNRDLIYQRAQTYFNDPDVAKYIWGIGFHWYEDWSGGKPMYDNIRRIHEAFPQTNIFFTEGCAESFNAARYNEWILGEEYGSSMINDFNNGMTGFTDWNIFLDETGGPNHVGNFCFAPVHADTKKDEIIYTNAYYYIGHFSKFLQPGAKRIAATATRSQLLTTAFLNPDGTKAVIVMNNTEKETPYYLWVNGKAAKTLAPPHSISTLIF